MIVLYFADIFGRPGRRALSVALPDLIANYTPDFVIGNVENLAGGRGTNRRTLQELLGMGFHGFTSGNHTWDNKEVYSLLETEARLFRPANFPSSASDPCPGRGYGMIHNGDKALFLVNIMGRVFMDQIDCPFHAIDKILKDNPSPHPVFVDFHADATSEKYAMGWHLAGRVAAVVGSHTHVQTADERILPGGTAYISDVGLTGSFDSVIGLRPQEVIKRFMTKRPHQYQQAKDNPGVSGVVIHIGHDNRAKKIERFRYEVKIDNWEREKDME